MPSPARFAAVTMAALVVVAAGCSSVSLDEPIEGRLWRLAQLEGQPVPPAAEPQRDAQLPHLPQLQFDESGASGGRLSGSGGCNRMSGPYQRNASTLRIGPLAATRMACTDPVRTDLETRFFAVLAATTSYRLNNGQLLLLGREGQTLAVLGEAGR